MKYTFLIEDALKSGNGIISPATQNILMDFALEEGATKERFLNDLRNKSSSWLVYKRETDPKDDHKCNTCGANIPVIAKVCEYCGAETGFSEGGNLTEQQVNAQIDNLLIRVQKTPKPKFLRTLFGNFYILMPLCLLYLVIIFEGTSYSGYMDEMQNYQRSDMEDAMFFLMFAGAFFILLKIIMVFAGKKKGIRLIRAKAEYEKLANIVRFQFGKESKFEDRLDTLYRNIVYYTSGSKQEDTYRAIIYIVFFVCITYHSTTFINYRLLTMHFEEIQTKPETTEDIMEAYKNMHYTITAVPGSITGPLEGYIRLDEGKYMAYQKNGISREDIFVNNVAFTVLKPFPKLVDTMVYSLTFSISDKNGKEIVYPDSTLVAGFYVDKPELVYRNGLAKNKKLLLHFKGFIDYREDSLPKQIRENGLTFKAVSVVHKDYSNNR